MEKDIGSSETTREASNTINKKQNKPSKLLTVKYFSFLDDEKG